MKQILDAPRLGRAAVAAVIIPIGVLSLNVDKVAAFVTSIIPYAEPVGTDYETRALLSVGDHVPESSDPAKEYQMIGIPDGLGAHASSRGRVTLYMNHELGNSVLSEPVIGEPRNRGAFVSKWILGRNGQVLSGERAYDTVYIDDTLVGPAAAEDNSTRGFGRFCSGSLAGPAEGFDRYIYFANEESGNADTFDGKGGLSVAIFDNQAHGLTDLGHFPWENTLVQPGYGRWTVIMGMEDGPANLNPAVENSQLYMYVGEKSRKHGATVLERNGLVGGTLYVFRSKDPAKNSEAPFQSGSIQGEWVVIAGADGMTQAQLEAASDAVGAMTFARPEDGTFNPRNRDEYFFVTTGGAAPGENVLGRVYSLRLNAHHPAGSASLEVLVNADAVIAGGGDAPISPDNVDASHQYLMVQEDGTAQSRLVMASKGRDGRIWRFDLTGGLGIDASSATPVVELAPPGRDGVAVGPGVWETSGIIDTGSLFGFGSWLFDVQAHAPTAAPALNSVEDGQLLLLVRNRRGHDDDDR